MKATDDFNKWLNEFGPGNREEANALLRVASGEFKIDCYGGSPGRGGCSWLISRDGGQPVILLTEHATDAFISIVKYNLANRKWRVTPVDVPEPPAKREFSFEDFCVD